MKKSIFAILTFLIVLNFLQADTITNHIYNAVRKMKTGLNCIDACWEDRSFTSSMQILNCITKCPREIECKNSNDLEDKIMCNTEKSVDAIFKCHKANIKNQKAARKCASDVVIKNLTKNVDEFEKSFSNIRDEIDSIMGYSSFANNASYSSEVRAASKVVEEDNYHSTIPDTWKNKTVTEIRNYEAVQASKVATANKNYSDMEEAKRRYQEEQEAARDRQRILADIQREKNQSSSSGGVNGCPMEYQQCNNMGTNLPCSKYVWYGYEAENACEHQSFLPGGSNLSENVSYKGVPASCCGR